MINSERRDVLLQGRPSIDYAGEPSLGSVYGEEEIEAAIRSIRHAAHPERGFRISGSEGELFEADIADYVGVQHAITINSAGVGLDMAMMSLDLEPGDEVICPSINFKAAPMAIIGQGGTWVPCEVDPKTLQADPEDVERRITERTRAILTVHMNGLSSPMDELLEIAQRRPHPIHGPLKVIGDAARAAGGAYKGQPIGAKGWMTIFSFHTQKNMTTLGEGGAITTDDDLLAQRLIKLRFFGGSDGWGSSYPMTSVQAAVGRVQLRKLDGFIDARRRVAEARTAMLRDIPELTVPCEPPDCRHSYYLYTMLVKREWAGEMRNRLCAMLRELHHVNTIIANPPVHSAVPFLQRHVGDLHLPISEDIGARLFCPPMHPAMSEEDNRYICAAIWDVVERLRAEEA